MDSISIQELLSLSIFKCKHCKKRCQYPAVTVDHIGNYCNSCLTQIKYRTAEVNTEINNILEKFNIPCRYNENGCDIVDKIKDVTKHEKMCDYRDKICPVYDCKNEFLSDIPDHFNSEHNQYVIESINDLIKLNLNLRDESNSDIIRLLVVNHDHFLLHAKFDMDNKILWYVLYFCGDPNDIKYFVCTIQQNNNDIHTTNMEFNLLHESEYTKDINKEKAIHYNLTSLKKCFDDEIETLIKFTHRHALTNVKNIDLLNTLKCITCKTFLRGEIRQCASGHSVCEECIHELKQCSVCNALFSGTRNYILENLSLLLKYPCPHKGCSKHFSSKYISRHESDCALKQYACPFREVIHCQTNGLHKDIIEHIKIEHPENSLLKSYCERNISLGNSNNEVYCLLTFNNIFRFQLEKESNVYSFSCKYLGNKNLAKRYTFEIGLISHSQRENKLMVKNSWSQDSDDELWVEIHNYDVNQYINASNEIILFYRIIKY